MKKRKGIGDIHSHHLIAETVPDDISKQQTKGLTENELKGFLGKFLGWLIYGKRYSEFVKILNSGSLEKVAEYHIQEMDEAGIDYSVVLGLDFAESDRKKHGFTIDYPEQIKHVATNCATYPFRLFQFFFFDPRREGVRELLEEAYANEGIVGIKLYPACGYDPRPYKVDFLGSHSNPQTIESNLQFLYRFAETHHLPIITHCSTGGSYQSAIQKIDRPKMIWKYTEPSNFLPIAEKYRLRICFAHMGGTFEEGTDKLVARQWRNQIFNLIQFADDSSEFESMFYTEPSNLLAYVSDSRKKRPLHIKEIKELMSSGDIGNKLMYGTDWPLARFKLSAKEYIDYYNNGLPKKMKDRFFSDNIVQFLFGPERRIPDNYIAFLKKHNSTLEPLPQWVKKEGDSYYMV